MRAVLKYPATVCATARAVTAACVAVICMAPASGLARADTGTAATAAVTPAADRSRRALAAHPDEPGHSEHILSEPDTSEPDIGAPEASEPDTGESETSKSNASAPDTDEPDTDEPGHSERILSEPDTGAPDTGEPDTSAPETSEPKTSKPDTSEPGTSEPETNEPDTGAPGTNEPDTSEPDTSAPDIGESDTGEPDTGEPDTNEPETGEPGISEPYYTGERLSLNFQDIDVRTVLQLIADVSEFNLLASDAVAGRITLRLHDVPWDQALDLVLQSTGLARRQLGDVLLVAPAATLAEREREAIAANRQQAELLPLQTGLIRIRYADAADIEQLLAANSGQADTLLSARGSVRVDERTNILIITDTAAKLDTIRQLIEQLDIPIRQVMIEARIVITRSDISRQLGIRWDGGYRNNNRVAVAGGLNDVVNLNQTAVVGGDPSDGLPAALLVDLGIIGSAGSFSLGYASRDLFLGAELAALEAQGSGEVVSQPKVITGDKQQASIKSGTEVPYQQSSANGETTIAFKEAVLRLDVTPSITPDNYILLDLIINQDSVGELVPSGTGGAIPTIDTTELATQVLVGDGETIVLGGVFRTEDIESVSKVPLLGDIPWLGRLFKRTNMQKTKTETLLFITPHILADAAVD